MLAKFLLDLTQQGYIVVFEEYVTFEKQKQYRAVTLKYGRINARASIRNEQFNDDCIIEAVMALKVSIDKHLRTT